ncbi:hypothetical protein HMPREF3217_00974, partial [Finegoldia magna]
MCIVNLGIYVESTLCGIIVYIHFMEEFMNKDKNIILKSIKILILCLICIFAFVGGLIGVAGVRAMQLAPKVNPEEINNMMNQTSEILDQDGNLIEKIKTTEYREVVKLDK